MNKPELVILAAGMGSRYGGLKQIDTVDEQGHIIIDFSIYDAIRAGFKDFTFIINKKIEKEFRSVLDSHLENKGINIKYVFQELDKLPDGFSCPKSRVKPWGTAHAILCCKDVVKGPFAVINADDYYGVNAFKEMYGFLEKNETDEKCHFSMIGYRVKNTVTEQGTVSRGVCEADEHGKLTSIVERKNVGIENGEVYYVLDGDRYTLDPDTLVSMNFWGFTPEYIDECAKRFSIFLEQNLKSDPEKCEFYLPVVVAELINEGKADVTVIDNVDKWYGVTYKEDKPCVVEAFSNLKKTGVYPENF